MTYLCLNSEKATNDNNYKLDESINGTYKLVSFTFTNNIFNVNDTNNTIYWNENNTDLESSLTNGFYDANDFESHLSSVMNSDGAGTIAVSINENTRKITITNTLNMYFKFGSNTLNSARKLLGFNESDGTASTSIESDNCIDLNTYKNIWIDFEENDNRMLSGIDYFNTSLYISGLGNFGEIVRYINRDNFDQYIKLKNTKKLTIKFHDNNNNSIDLNSNYEIILEKC